MRAEDDPLDLAKPRGKQDWKLEPHSIWYPRTTGIWQTVWLETSFGGAYRATKLDIESSALGNRPASAGIRPSYRWSAIERVHAGGGSPVSRRQLLGGRR